ncbi:hypothetical protein TCAL_02880 [Tigriopus californicus]|uniref:non-specific serine/threonine protein kinase n=1 Tax=Tigriopus californicus TaxID=6832 RepID=A0A553NY91_TIGCA|nr:SRSF protein kinase 3-like isoform X1 [Tigriopus californicus]TRY70378.1 hypothetical protein TCAL_02880 [Tigriopus californicus]
MSAFDFADESEASFSESLESAWILDHVLETLSECLQLSSLLFLFPSTHDDPVVVPTPTLRHHIRHFLICMLEMLAILFCIAFLKRVLHYDVFAPSVSHASLTSFEEEEENQEQFNNGESSCEGDEQRCRPFVPLLQTNRQVSGSTFIASSHRRALKRKFTNHHHVEPGNSSEASGNASSYISSSSSASSYSLSELSISSESVATSSLISEDDSNLDLSSTHDDDDEEEEDQVSVNTQSYLASENFNSVNATLSRYDSDDISDDESSFDNELIDTGVFPQNGMIPFDDGGDENHVKVKDHDIEENCSICSDISWFHEHFEREQIIKEVESSVLEVSLKPDERSDTRTQDDIEDEEEEEEEILGSDDDEQEDPKDYVKGGYHPVKIGDLFHNRYHVVRKLGWGHFSTVWLCWDLTDKKFVALKVVKSAAHYTETALDEIKLLKCVRESDEKDENRERCVQLLDDFKINGVNGTHVCMVFEVLGHNLLKFIIRSNYQGIPLYNVKLIMKQVLEGLQYLHSKCQIIHTDIKPENVLMCVDEAHIRKIAADATYFHKMGIKLPGSAVSTAPKELREVDMNAKMSKSKKKKLKKRAKRNQALMEETMQHIEEVEREEMSHKDKDTNDEDTNDHHHNKINGARGDNSGQENGKTILEDGEHDDDERETAVVKTQFREQDSKKTHHGEDEVTVDDIEKRKSFADMKMADIALGGQDWNFSSKESNHKKSAESDLVCNGHEDPGGLEMASSKKKNNARGLGSVDAHSDANTPTKKNHPSSPEAEKLNESNGSGDGGLPNFGMGAGTPGTPAQRKPDPVHEICPEMQVKIADLGNACWVDHHFTEDIQTRQYRSLEVLLGAGYGPPADIWSTACMAFEMATGDYLFEPHSGEDYSRDEDHLAHIIELVGVIPRNIVHSGRYSRDFFNRRGELRHITKLKPWPLYEVLTEKYEWDPEVAKGFSDWLMPMLAFDPTQRATAEDCLKHPFLTDV